MLVILIYPVVDISHALLPASGPWADAAEEVHYLDLVRLTASPMPTHSRSSQFIT